MRAAALLVVALLVSATAGAGAFAPDAASDASLPDASGAVGAIDTGTTAQQTETPDGSTDNETDGDSTDNETDGSPDQTGEEPTVNGTHVLVIPTDEITRSAVERQRADLGPAVGFDVQAADERLDTAAVVDRIESAETPEERQRRILGAVSEVEQDLVTLNQREREAIAAYGEGEIGERELLAELAAVSVRATALEERVDRLGDLADETEDFTLDTSRTNAIRFRLRTFDGPVRNYATAIITGERPPDRVFVETGPDSVVLTAIVDDTYVREVVRGDRVERTGATIDPLEAQENVTAESYPSIWETRLQSSATSAGSTAIVTIAHEHGELVAFVDAGSRQVFKEYQTRPLETFDRGATVQRVQDGLNLTVNRTYPGGPVRVEVRDADTDEPIDATITVGTGGAESRIVGSTGDDGVLWTLSPRGEFRVTAFHGEASAAFVQVQPIEPLAVPEDDEE